MNLVKYGKWEWGTAYLQFLLLVYHVVCVCTYIILCKYLVVCAARVG